MRFRHILTIHLLLLFMSMEAVAQVTLVPTASFFGTENYERVGYHLHTAGDVNNDGYDDFLIGTFHNGRKGHNSGAAYLILGKAEADWGKGVSLNSANARFQGSRAYDAVGYCVGGDGDLNGDGYDDILIGAPAGDEQVITNPGHLYVIFGKANSDYGFNFITPYSANASFDGEDEHDLAGLSAAFIGDMNQDGYDDIITSAPYSDYGGTDAGKVYIILGKASGWSRGINLGDADASFYGSSQNGLFGYSVDGIGDMNGDGIVDFAIGERGQGNVYIFWGRKSVDWGLNFHASNADVVLSREQYGNWAGWRVSRAGDVNGDGLDDLLIGAPMHDQQGNERGKIYLFFGRSGNWPNYMGAADASFIGEGQYDQAGWDVQDVGDVNNDGYADFMIGAWYNDSNGQDSGEIYLIKGRSWGWSANTSLSSISDHFVGEHAIDYAGFSVATPGDVNGDGWNDLMTSETYNSEAYYWGGKILLFVSDGPPLLQPQLSISDTQLDFASSDTSLFITIENVGSGIMEWQAAENPWKDWITGITPSSGSLSQNQQIDVYIQVNRTGLSVGQYSGNIQVTSNGGNGNVAISMTVADSPPAIITDLSIEKKSANNIELSWTAVANVNHYNIYRGSNPYFVTDQVHATTTELIFEDENCLGDANVNYFYYVTAENMTGESEISNRVGEYDYQLVTTSFTDFNEIALPLVQENVSKASDLMAVVPNCNSVAVWDASVQGFKQYVDWLPPSDFPVHSGYPYYINISQSAIFSIVGGYANTSYNLITTDLTDFNEIMHPLDKLHVQTAAQLLAEIPYCNSVARWDAPSQSYEQYVTWLPPSNFDVRIGYPYFVNVTEDVVWPDAGGTIRLEKEVYNPRHDHIGDASSYIPHIVYGQLDLNSDVIPEKLAMQAFRVDSPEDILSGNDTGCKLHESGYFWIQCANFINPWSPGDRVVFNFIEEENYNTVMTYEAILDTEPATKATLIETKPFIQSVDSDMNMLCYPNPYNTKTMIQFNLNEAGYVNVSIYNQVGQIVTTLIEEYLNPGNHELVWDSQNIYNTVVSSGLYFIVLNTQNHTAVKKTILLK